MFGPSAPLQVQTVHRPSPTFVEVATGVTEPEHESRSPVPAVVAYLFNRAAESSRVFAL